MIPIKDIIPPRARPWAAMTVLFAGVLEFSVARWLDLPNRQSLVELAANAAALWLFADNVEDRLGRHGFLALYLLSNVLGAGAAAFVSAWTPLPLILSSGAAAGILGAYFVLYPRSRVLTLFPLPFDLFEVPAVFFLCTFVIVQLPGGLAVIADLTAGLAAGAALCLVLKRPMVW